jgi:hypothetical protein
MNGADGRACIWSGFFEVLSKRGVNQNSRGGGEIIFGVILEKAFEPQISQKSTDYQYLAEFKALTLRVNCVGAIFDT